METAAPRSTTCSQLSAGVLDPLTTATEVLPTVCDTRQNCFARIFDGLYALCSALLGRPSAPIFLARSSIPAPITVFYTIPIATIMATSQSTPMPHTPAQTPLIHCNQRASCRSALSTTLLLRNKIAAPRERKQSRTTLCHCPCTIGYHTVLPRVSSSRRYSALPPQRITSLLSGTTLPSISPLT